CGGTSTSSPAANGGKTALLITDRPEQEIMDDQGNLITTATEVWVTMSEASFKTEGGQWNTVFNGPPKTFDLLTLHGSSDLIALVDLPPGRYEKARLTVDSAHFVDANGDHPLKVPSHKIIIKFKQDLVITADGTEQVLFDFIPGKSIHLVGTGNGTYILRPVIRVQILGSTGDDETDSVRIEGTIASLDCANHRLTLEEKISGNTITVDLEGASIIKRGDIEDGDSEEEEGERNVIACEALKVGDRIDVIGTFDDQEILHASSILVKEKTIGEFRIEFVGSLISVDCDAKTLTVTFSGGSIQVLLTDSTAFFSAEGWTSITCTDLENDLQKRVAIEGTVANSQVTASRVIVLAPQTEVFTHIEGTIDSLTLDGTQTVGFVLKAADGTIYDVTIGTGTDIRDASGNPITVDQLAVDQRVSVEGKLDLSTSPNSTLAAIEIKILL
ncbi:MAG TPA: DUF4382 domain-containing protein, partial [Nitrospiria bacterium]|nr:DUF4382 domain-containing protein [Nitrospiria bacterium]